MKPIHPLLARLLPFIIIAVMLFLFIVGIFLFSYILIFALIVGFILFVIGFIRAKFFKSTKNRVHEEFIFDIQREKNNKPEHIGRIIEHDEDNKNQ